MSTGASTSPLATTIGEEYARYIQHLADRVERAARALPKEKLWNKPFAFGNSVGHLILHLTGNMNHYVGALIAGTGYIRDRPREFTEPAPPPAEEAMAKFRGAVAMVIHTVRAQDDAGLMTAVTDQPPVQTRFGLLLVVTAHLNNHIGQMAYLVQAQGHSTQEPPIW